MSDDTPTITPEVLSRSNQKAFRGPFGNGIRNHKPHCQCFVCKATRKRQEEARLDAAGGEEIFPAKIDPNGSPAELEVLNADLPVFYSFERNARAHVAAWIKFRATEPGITNKEIARRLGISTSSLNSVIAKANKEGWLIFEDPMAKLEHEIIPRTIDNLKHFLDKKDKTVTVEVAKGTIFRQFQESKGILDRPTTILALKIEAPESGPEIKIVSGTIMGKPRTLQGETELSG